MDAKRTQTLTVHRLRRIARREERRLQADLDYKLPAFDKTGKKLPSWVRGVRVEKIGSFQFALVATSVRGR